MIFKQLKAYWTLCLFKNSPENTPYSLSLTFALGLLFYFVMISQWLMVKGEVPLGFKQMVMAGLSLAMTYAAYTFVILKVYRLQFRFLQTLASLFATHAWVHICAYPLLLLTPFLGEQNALPGLLGLFMMLIYLTVTLGLTGWQLVITVYIYKKALEVDNILAIFVTMGLFALNILVVSLLR